MSRKNKDGSWLHGQQTGIGRGRNPAEEKKISGSRAENKKRDRSAWTDSASEGPGETASENDKPCKQAASRSGRTSLKRHCLSMQIVAIKNPAGSTDLWSLPGSGWLR